MSDDIDTSANLGNDTLSTSEPSADTATVESTQVDTQSSDPTSTETSVDAGVADATNQSNDGQQPLADTNAAPAQVNPYEKQYKEVQGWATKVRQQNLDLQRQLQDLQAQVQAQQQKQSVDSGLKPWDEGHQEHQTFLRYFQEAEYFDDLIRGEENPEFKQRLIEKQTQRLGDKGIQMLREHRSAVQDYQRQMRLNPWAHQNKVISEKSRAEAQAVLQSTSQSYQVQIQARDHVQSWIKGNTEVSTPENIRAVLGLMEKGVSFDQASAVVERDYYRSQVSNAKKVAASAGEKERLLQGNAAGGISRNPNASKKIDVSKHLKEKGLPDSRSRIDELFNLDQQGLL